ncbi:hypothetical protein [uncultured Psychrobacter sp.]|uniref:hypothetical protein n=1 Tax=uncultured Psychrobacter sp. TaxID=259303 RepID=UPI0030DA65E4
MKEVSDNKFEKVVTVILVLIVIFIGSLIIRNFYELSQHESLTFKIKTTYMKDGYSYTDEKTECVMYDPDTINDIDVIKIYQSKNAIENTEHLEQKVFATKHCSWIWMPKSEDIYR